MAAGLTRVGRFLRWQALVVSLALAAAVCGAATGVPAAAASAATSASCRHAAGPFRVAGTRVTGAGGRVYVPYGITVPGLANYPNWKAAMAADHKKILATASSWCANTVRLQVSQDNLLGLQGTGFSAAYMDAIATEVSWAEKQHLVVVLNDQTETVEPKPYSVNYQRAPTPGTETFWTDMILAYGSDKQVIFDLFNEPRTYSRGMSQAQEWGLWHNGGTFAGRKYIGMAKLAADVRAAGSHNLFWVEGPDFAATFAGMERQHALLRTAGIVYAVHHPYGAHTTKAWHDDFAYLVITHVAPVVDGEWTNYRPFSHHPNPECWADAPKQVPVFLGYLATYGIGMTAYQLAEGLLVKSNTNLADPTTINAATWSCSPTKKPANEGAGAVIMSWYRAHNR